MTRPEKQNQEKKKLPRNIFFPRNRRHKCKKHAEEAEACDAWPQKLRKELEEDNDG